MLIIIQCKVHYNVHSTLYHRRYWDIYVPWTHKGNCSGKKIKKIIPSIDRECGTDAQGGKLDFLHGSVRRYKTLRSSTNCGCGHLMTHFVGIAIANSS